MEYYLNSEFPRLVVDVVFCAKFHKRLPDLVCSVVAEGMKFHVGFEVEIVVPVVDGGRNNSLHPHHRKSSYRILHLQQQAHQHGLQVEYYVIIATTI